MASGEKGDGSTILLPFIKREGNKRLSGNLLGPWAGGRALVSREATPGLGRRSLPRNQMALGVWIMTNVVAHSIFITRTK